MTTEDAIRVAFTCKHDRDIETLQKASEALSRAKLYEVRLVIEMKIMLHLHLLSKDEMCPKKSEH